MVSDSNLVIHIINTTEILAVINQFKTNIVQLEREFKELLYIELEHLKNKVNIFLSKQVEGKKSYRFGRQCTEMVSEL